MRRPVTLLTLTTLVTAALLAPAQVGAGARKCDGKTVTKRGTDGDDRIEGSDGRDVIWTGPGDDHVDTLGGDDVICAGRGHDVVLAGLGNDRIWGAGGNDDLTAGRGHDFVDGGDGADHIEAGDQSDEVHGHGGPDFIDIGNSVTARGDGDVGYGGLGRDRLKATGDETYTLSTKLFGNAGDDTLLGEFKGHVLDGGPGTDACSPEATRRDCEREP